MRRQRPFPIYWSAILAVVLGAVAVPATALAEGEDVAPADGATPPADPAPAAPTPPAPSEPEPDDGDDAPAPPSTAEPGDEPAAPESPDTAGARDDDAGDGAGTGAEHAAANPGGDRPPASHRRLRRLPSSRLRVTTSSSRMPSRSLPRRDRSADRLPGAGAGAVRQRLGELP